LAWSPSFGGASQGQAAGDGVEVLFQGLLGILEVLGHATGRAVVRLLTGGRVKVAPLGRREIVRRWHGLHRTTDGTPVIGEGLATAVGAVIPVAPFFFASGATASSRSRNTSSAGRDLAFSIILSNALP